MAIEIKLPELGEKLEGGEVLDMKVGVGDLVSEGQTLMEVEAEKSTVEVPSPLAGKITKLLVKKGDQVLVNQTFCYIESATVKTDGTAAVPATDETKTQDISIKSKSKEINTKDTPKKGADDIAATDFDPAYPPDSPSQPLAHRTQPDGKKRSHVALVPAGPATRRLARELGIDLHLVSGSADRGRITQEDVKAFVRHLASGAASSRVVKSQPPPLPDFKRWGPVESQPLDPVRRRTAEQMSLAWTLVPHVTQHDEADVTDLETFRRQQTGDGPKLTVTAFVLKAIAVVLKQFPQFSSSLDAASSQLILKRYCHIGVAVDTERGLLVPVLRDVDKKSVHELAREITEMADKARQKKLHVEDMKGGTFTVTNLGGIGGTGFSPIVNYPEVAILGLARAKLQPVVQNGQVVPRLILPLSLSYDHRVIDGADAARFTRRLAEMLENPLVMLVHA